MDFTPTVMITLFRGDPNLAELHLTFANVPAGVEIRGRLLGPRCPGLSTIEVAYHFQPLTPTTCRVLIPEPSYWTPERPYVYEGKAEFHSAGQPLGTLPISCGIRS